MNVDRREFLAATGTAGAAGLLASLGIGESPTVAYASEGPETAADDVLTTTSICPYCAVGCGLLVTAGQVDGRRKVIRIEGDVEHPINRGTLCPKGASLSQLVDNPWRLSSVLYRKPGGTRFEQKDPAWAAREIAKRIKTTRDATFTTANAKGQVVNRTTAIASVGSAALDNEECWIYQKMLRAIGLVCIEHQARL